MGIGNSVTAPAGVIRPILPTGFGEPEVAVRAGRDAGGSAAGRGDRELGDDAGGGDPADLVASGLGEPEVAVGAGRDAVGRAAGGGWTGNSVMTPSA